MKPEITDVKNPRWGGTDNKSVFLSIVVDGKDGFFVAMPNDPEEHGRDLYYRTLEGEFGEIAPYVEPEVDLEELKRHAVQTIGKKAEAARNTMPPDLMQLSDEDAAAAWLDRINEIEKDRMMVLRAIAQCQSVEDMRNINLRRLA